MPLSRPAHDDEALDGAANGIMHSVNSDVQRRTIIRRP
jgi:hypothetical protein